MPNEMKADSQNLLSVYLFVDERLRGHDDDPEDDRRDDVRRVLSVFSEEQQDVFAQLRDSPLGRDAPNIEAALARLAADEEVGHRAAARRMLAIAALIRAEEAFAPGQARANEAEDALRPIRGEHPDPAALLRLLAQPVGGSFEDWWANLIDTGVAQGLLPEAFKLQKDAPPGMCTTKPVAGGIELTTDFVAAGLTLADVQDYLHPVNWPECADLWCEMKEVGSRPYSGVHRYREVIGLSCAGRKLVTYLDFTFDGSPVTKVAYKLSGNQGTDSSDGLEVDEGHIIAFEQKTGARTDTHIITFKRVWFKNEWRYLNGLIEVFACLLGYGTVGEDMVFSCAADPNRHKAKSWKHHTSCTGELDSSVLADAMDGMIAMWCCCMAECAEDYRKSLARAERGKYKANDLTRDMARAWVRAGRHTMAMSRAAMIRLQADDG